MSQHLQNVAVILKCEGLGDCLFAIPVIEKLTCDLDPGQTFVVFTHHPALFKNCPYVAAALDIHDVEEMKKYGKQLPLFELEKLPHHLMDTFDFISVPTGIGELSFREKQLKYFPIEQDFSEHFNVVINTSVTWPSRSWPLNSWQEVADFITGRGYSVAVVGKDTWSRSDNVLKKSYGLKGCVNLTNRLSLDQTYYTINNCDLFITCQNGLSVLSGATDAEIMILDMSIEWSKRAIYRKQNPHYKVNYVKGNCDIYCCQALFCPAYGDFRCLPAIQEVIDCLSSKLDAIKKKT